MDGKESDQWKEAMKSKYSSLLKNDTWELVTQPEGTNIVGSRWVFKIKRNEDGSIDHFKARLVAQGYSQVEGVDYKEVFSPVAHYTFVRLLLALANVPDLEIQRRPNGCKNCNFKWFIGLCNLHVATRRIC